MSRSRALPLAALGLLTAIWGYNWVVMKVALADCPPLLFAALRVLAGAATFVPVLLVLRRPLAPPPLRYVIPLGLLQTTGFVGFALWALAHGAAGTTAVLVYMMPIWLMILAWPLLGERIRGLQWPALFLALAGVLCIVAPWQTHAPLLGTGLALASGLFWALSAIWQKRQAPAGLDLLRVTFWQMITGGGVLAVMAACLGPLSVHWTGLFVGALLYNAIPGTTVALALWGYALHNLRPGIAGMATLVGPLIGVLAAWLQLGERPVFLEGMGMLAIFAALALVTWQHLAD
ncbi:MAG: DMT family transporter [Gammaproteobacteria bacterium]|nr:DMT family transporter [Gammaproteobacteria bacterium]